MHHVCVGLSHHSHRAHSAGFFRFFRFFRSCHFVLVTQSPVEFSISHDEAASAPVPGYGLLGKNSEKIRGRWHS